MRTPIFAFRHQATVKKFIGNTSIGTSYGREKQYRCWIEFRDKLITDANGDNITSPAKALFPSSASITPQSVVTYNGREYKVMSVAPQYSYSGIAHVEVTLV